MPSPVVDSSISGRVYENSVVYTFIHKKKKLENENFHFLLLRENWKLIWRRSMSIVDEEFFCCSITFVDIPSIDGARGEMAYHIWHHDQPTANDCDVKFFRWWCLSRRSLTEMSTDDTALCIWTSHTESADD